MARGLKTGIIGTVFAGMIGVAGFGAYNIYTSLDGGSGGGAGTAKVADTSPPDAKDVTNTAADFLTAWASGDDAKAAGLTDSVRTATTALAAYKTQAHITKVALTPNPATGTTVPFTVRATISYQGTEKIWSYTSTLAVARDVAGKPAVKWASSVLEPDLQPGQSLITGQAASPDIDLVDRHGVKMTAEQYPGLTDVFADLRNRYKGAHLGGTPGIETYVVGVDGSTVKTLYVVKAGRNSQIKTTLDAKIQAAAEKAVTKYGQSGVTALDTTNGNILAMAANPPGGTNYALSLQPPGSTFKIVTATALMLAPPSAAYPHGISPSVTSQCVDGYAATGGKAYHNVTPDNPKATLSWDFSKSCNTGFIRLSKYLDQGSLGRTGLDYYGLGGPEWYTGTGTTDGRIPGGTGDEMTSEMIGQGQVQMNTLNMASVAATVRDGRFHQPSILQDHDLIENRQAISTKALPSGIRKNLMAMMKLTVTNGTASGVMTGVKSPYGAKTGSAEENQNDLPTGWFTAYSGHVAAAAMVVQGDHGNRSAGPIVAAVLRAS
jgi:hypothetical protein